MGNKRANRPPNIDDNALWLFWRLSKAELIEAYAALHREAMYLLGTTCHYDQEGRRLLSTQLGINADWSEELRDYCHSEKVLREMDRRR